MTIFTNSIKILKIAKIRMNNTRLELVSIQEMWTRKKSEHFLFKVVKNLMVFDKKLTNLKSYFLY